MIKSGLTRRGLLKTGAVAGAGLALPTIFTSRASAFTNEPKADTVTFGFTVPQTGPYADEGADELRAFQLAVKHLNGQGDGGLLQTFSSKALTGAGISDLWQNILDHRTAMSASGEFAERRRQQQIKWMWSMLEQRMMAGLGSEAAIRARVKKIEADVAEGRVTPALAADRIAEMLG